MTIKGLDKLQKTLSQAARALEETDGHIGDVKFDPNDPASIEHAIAQMEAMIDAKFEGAENNPIVRQMSDAMKEQYRAGILEKAAAARLKGDQ